MSNIIKAGVVLSVAAIAPKIIFGEAFGHPRYDQLERCAHALEWETCEQLSALAWFPSSHLLGIITLSFIAAFTIRDLFRTGAKS